MDAYTDQPAVFFDEEKAARARDDPDAHRHEDQGSTGLPIVDGMLAFFGLIGAWFTFSAAGGGNS